MFKIKKNKKNKSAVILNPERSEWVSRSHVTGVEPVVNDGAKTKRYSAKRDLYGDFAYAQPLKMTDNSLSLSGASSEKQKESSLILRKAKFQAIFKFALSSASGGAGGGKYNRIPAFVSMSVLLIRRSLEKFFKKNFRDDSSFFVASPKDSLHRHSEPKAKNPKNNIKDWILRFVNASLRMTIPALAFLLSLNISTAFADSCKSGEKVCGTGCIAESMECKSCGGSCYYTQTTDGAVTLYGSGEAMTGYEWKNVGGNWGFYSGNTADTKHPFYNNSDITSVTFDESSNFTSIGKRAFTGMTGVTGALTIPDSVTSIEDYAFSNMPGVTGALTIPDSVTSIGHGAFYNMTGVQSLTIGDSVTSIGEAAFQMMSGVTGALTIPDSVTSIGVAAFDSMTDVTSLTIPEGVTSIGDWAFKDMTKLSELVIPDSWADDGFTLNDGSFYESCFSSSSSDRPDECSADAKIVCQGDKVKCQTALAKLGGTGKCTTSSHYCINPSQIVEATESQCTGGMYEWNSTTSKCERLGQDACNATSKYYFNSTNNQCQVLPKTQASCTALNSGDENISWNSTTSTCSRAVPQTPVDSGASTGGDEIGGTSTDGDISGDFNPADCYNKGQVPYDNKCWDEYPFAKKRWTPAEATKWLHDGNDNFVVITFKK